MPAGSAPGGLFKFLRPRMRPQSDDIQAATVWGIAATAGAMYLIQPYDWIMKTFFEKPEEQ